MIGYALGLAQTDYSALPGDDYQQRSKRDVYDDLVEAIKLLKDFDAKLAKLHPAVAWKVKEIMK